ncbi:MAG: menaquinone biosynthesis protein [Verrucomicrobiota bacterium]|jgi:chorismate dehydratase|nr:menaquinone biosynthesis protein [Verrucomicrobiota bacterium]
MNKQCVNRIGSVPYLNSVPLTCGIEKETSFVIPSELAKLIRAGKVDAALVSTTEVLFHDGYEVLDSVAITSHGPVKSVFLAHRQPLEEIQTIHCDTASLTSVNLLRVLLTKRGLVPAFEPLTDYSQAAALDNVLLIGNHGIGFLRAPHDHVIWDLGAAWHELTGLPFVYAVWALRRGHHDEALRAKLLAAKENGLANLAQIITEHPDYDAEFRKAYLGGHIRYDLNSPEKAGLNKFVELLQTQSGKPVFEPTYV